ncbi:MAG: endolytic transglycosylase MltG [Tissierellales bacterium]|jgi:hypothetical protein|nr:endolytic transglycosylase MltG [Tissierellales bacterium]
MRTFSDKAKDFFYDIVDYIIIGVVVICVLGILDWRLGIVFDNKIAAVESAETGTSSEVIREIETVTEAGIIDDEDKPISVSIDLSEQTASNSNESTTVSNNSQANANSGNKSSVVSKKVKIPSGSTSQKIGQILVDSNIIASKSEFLKRAGELKLDTKLQSGTFDLSSDMSLDNIIKKIAGR